MPTHIVLLRAVNVSGANKLPMAQFRQLLEDLGYAQVETYIQSGNAVFDDDTNSHQVAEAIAAALEPVLGRRIGVLARSLPELEALIAANPFAAEAAVDGARVHAVLLWEPPDPARVTGLAAIPARNERYQVVGSTLYLHLPDGAADTKFVAKTIERILGVTTTARNWNTVLKLASMARR